MIKQLRGASAINHPALFSSAPTRCATHSHRSRCSNRIWSAERPGVATHTVIILHPPCPGAGANAAEQKFSCIAVSEG
jgi:hypothetical protein